MWYLQPFTKYLGQTLIFNYQKSLISVVQKIFTITDKIFILGGGMGSNQDPKS